MLLVSFLFYAGLFFHRVRDTALVSCHCHNIFLSRLHQFVLYSKIERIKIEDVALWAN